MLWLKRLPQLLLVCKLGKSEGGGTGMAPTVGGHWPYGGGPQTGISVPSQLKPELALTCFLSPHQKEKGTCVLSDSYALAGWVDFSVGVVGEGFRLACNLLREGRGLKWDRVHCCNGGR